MNFPSSRLLRSSSPLVPSRAFILFLLPSSILLPVPRVPTQASRSVHTPPSLLQFFLFAEKKKARSSIEPRNHDFSSFFSSSLFLLSPPPPPESDRRPCCFSASTVRIVRSWLSSTFLLLFLLLFACFASITSRRRRESLPPLHLAALTPTGARCASVTLLRFPFRKNRHSIVYLHLRLLLERDRSPRINNGPPFPAPLPRGRRWKEITDSVRLAVIFLATDRSPPGSLEH